MNADQRQVLKIYPNAYAAYSTLKGYWRIYESSYCNIIGIGTTERKAWKNAAIIVEG